jgi:hypothetical protein
MGKSRPPEGVILPPELDDDEEIAGGGIPDDDGWIHLEGKKDGLSEGDSRKRKAVARKPKLVSRAVKRAPKRNP